MECHEDKVRISKKISPAMMIKIVREEYYRLHYETVMSGDFMKWYQHYCNEMFRILDQCDYL